MSDKTLQDLLKLDLSRVTTEPYTLTNADVPEQKTRLLSEIMRGTTIDDKWKTPSVDLLTSLRDRKPTVVEDIIWATGSSIPKLISDTVAAGAVKLGTDPVEFGIGSMAAVKGAGAGAAAGSAVGKGALGWAGKFAGKAGALAGGVVGGVATGLAAGALVGTALETKPAGDVNEALGLPYYSNMIRDLDIKHANEEISDEEFESKRSALLKERDAWIKMRTENSIPYNELINDIKGRTYPEKDIVDSLVSWGAKTLKDNADWREWQKEQRGMSPDATAENVGAGLAYIASLWGGSKIYGAGLKAPRLKKVKGVYNVKTGTNKIMEVPSPYTRREMVERLENFGKGYSFATMSGEYIQKDILDYIEKTGDVDLVNYKPSSIQSAMAGSYGAIGTITEYGLGGIDNLIAGSFKKVGIKLPLAKATAVVTLQESAEEGIQELEEFLAGKVDGTEKRTWGEALRDAAVAAGWGAAFGAPIGGFAFHTNRRNLIKGIKAYGKGKINDAQAAQVADAMIGSVVNTMNYNNQTLWDNLRQKVSYMVENSDIQNKESTIDAMTNLEYSLIMFDSTNDGIDMAEHPLFKGEVTPIGWFRAGISENVRPVVEGLITELNDLQTQLKTLNEAKEKDWEKIDEIERKLEQFDRYVLDKLGTNAPASMRELENELRKVEGKYVAKEKKKAGIAVPTDVVSEEKQILDNLDKTEDKTIADTTIPKGTPAEESKPLRDAQTKFYKDRLEALGKILANRGLRIEPVQDTDTVSAYMTIRDGNNNVVAIARMARKGHPKKKIPKNAKLIELTASESVYDNLKQIENELSADNVMFQKSIKGAKRFGAYIPELRFIQRVNKMDASTLSHELAHDWFEVNFDKFRSGNANAEFMRAWGALEKALGITDKSTKAEKNKASEAFARAYEGWIMDNKDWSKLINVDDKDKDAITKLMQDYQSNLRDIYQDLTNPYFKQTWGKLGEMKQEIKAWFDKVINITDIDTLVDRGEMTAEEGAQEKLNRAIDTVIENTEDAETARTLKNVRTLNDTSRYEVEGGNKNALQRRIGALAQAIDENNMLIKENYDTRRDMLEVAKQADNFVRTRLDDALAIINGQMAEQEGLFKEDIYTALERLALEEGDLNLLDELKNSEIANRLAKELGQRVAGFRNWNAGDMDVVSSLKALDNKFNKALENKKAQAQMAEAEQLFAKAQEQQDKLADKELDSILKDMECK